MSTPLPGQRAGQSPLRAATASQRAMGRAASASGAMAETVILNIRGRFMRVVIHEDGAQGLEPYELDQEQE